jgi:hypothetical protein
MHKAKLFNIRLCHHVPNHLFVNMSENYLARIISLLNRAQPDGLSFDALTFHLYNSEQDFFGDRPDIRTVASRLRTILDTYSTHITLDEQGGYHLHKGIPQQLSINFEAPQEHNESEIIITTQDEKDFGEQLLFDFSDESTELHEQEPAPTPSPPPYPFPTLFDNDPNFI